jgi:hypothetical protein
MKKIFLFIGIWQLSFCFAQNQNVPFEILNNLDSIIKEYSSNQSFKSFNSESTSLRVIQGYKSLFKQNASIINTILPIQFEEKGIYKPTTIKFRKININELPQIISTHFANGIGFKILNKNVSFSKIDSGIVKLLLARQFNLTLKSGLNYITFDTVVMNIEVEGSNVLKIQSINLLNNKSYRVEVLNDKDFDQIPDDVDTLNADEEAKMDKTNVKKSESTLQKNILNRKIINKKRVGLTLSTGTNVQYFKTNNGVQQPSLTFFPDKTSIPPLTILFDAYYKDRFVNDFLYYKVDVNLMYLNYEMYSKNLDVENPSRFQNDSKSLTSNDLINLGFSLGLGYIRNINSKLSFDLDVNFLANKQVYGNSQLNYTESGINKTIQASFGSSYGVYFVSNPSLIYHMNEKSNLIFGINGAIGQTFVQDSSPKGFKFLLNDNFIPLQNSSTVIALSNIGLNIGYEYLIK